MLRQTVQDNDELYAAGIGYEPTLYDNFAPYAYDPGGQYEGASVQGGSGTDEVVVTDLGKHGQAYDVGDWYQLPFQTLHAVWTEPYYQEGGGDVILATYAVPVQLRDDEAPVSAVVTGDISLFWLRRLLQNIDVGDGGYAFLISRNGTFIAHPDPGFIMNQSIFSVAAARHDAQLRAIGQKMTAGSSGYVLFDGLRSMKADGASWLAYRPVSSTGWSLGIVVSDSAISADVVALNRIQWGIALVGIAALLVITLLIARTITRPIRGLDARHADARAGRPGRAPAEGQGARRDRPADHVVRADARRPQAAHRRAARVRRRRRSACDSELRIAADIQMDLVPRTFPPYPAAARPGALRPLEPAREVGGDFYDFVEMDDDRLCLAIADVSGKGVPAALLMAVGRSFLRSFVARGRQPGGDRQEPQRGARRGQRHEHVRDHVPGRRRPAHRRRALRQRRSQPAVRRPPRRRGGARSRASRASPSARGRAWSTTRATLTLAPGDVLFLYTDGVSEAMDAADVVFTEERIGEELERTAGRRAAPRASRWCEHMPPPCARHADGVEQFDDVDHAGVPLPRGAEE